MARRFTGTELIKEALVLQDALRQLFNRDYVNEEISLYISPEELRELLSMKQLPNGYSMMGYFEDGPDRIRVEYKSGSAVEVHVYTSHVDTVRRVSDAVDSSHVYLEADAQVLSAFSSPYEMYTFLDKVYREIFENTRIHVGSGWQIGNIQFRHSFILREYKNRVTAPLRLYVHQYEPGSSEELRAFITSANSAGNDVFEYLDKIFFFHQNGDRRFSAAVMERIMMTDWEMITNAWRSCYLKLGSSGTLSVNRCEHQDQPGRIDVDVDEYSTPFDEVKRVFTRVPLLLNVSGGAGSGDQRAILERIVSRKKFLCTVAAFRTLPRLRSKGRAISSIPKELWLEVSKMIYGTMM